VYKPGDLIVYGSEGVCRVDQVGPLDSPQADRARTYYTLLPLYHDGKVYTPVDTAVSIRPVISRAEAESMISGLASLKAEIFETRNLRELEEHYKKQLNSHCCADLFALIRSIRMKRVKLNEAGKKLGVIDERYMKRAEDMLHGELAVALSIPRDDVAGYIAEHASEPEAAAL